MVDFGETIFIKAPKIDGDVFVFDKSPEQQEEDFNNGIARCGGSWTNVSGVNGDDIFCPPRANPNYAVAYVKAARFLIEHGRLERDYDEIGLPAFYLQRHALELLLKKILSYLYEEENLRTTQKFDQLKVCNKLKKLRHEHEKILNEIIQVCKELNYPIPPEVVKTLVSDFSKIDPTGEFARYAYSCNKHNKTEHLKDEHVIPIVIMQDGSV